ncbi:MAG: Hsp20/alpha crystallin family protein [Microgenomates group bacterium]
MAFELIPKSFWTFPSFRFPSLWEEEDEEKWLSLPSAPSGLTVSEDDKNVYVEAAVPGVEPEDVEVTFDKGVLRIKAETKHEEKGKKYYRQASGSFYYQVLVPGNVDLEAEPEATSKNGVIKLTFKKIPETKPKKITVKKA